ncbi:MAG: phosphate butyryltransferase [Bacteroidales bacterium]|nr:phosphate butyryltransferase [Bacteroidales bacterium]
MKINKLDQLFDVLKSKPRRRIVAAYANDSHTIEAIGKAIDMGIVEGTLVGDEATIKKICSDLKIDSSKFRIVQEADEMKAATKAVELINKGEGEVLMKGLVSSDKYMRAILNKETGLMPPKAILTHVTVLEIPTYHKLLVFGDAAILPAPDLSQKIALTEYLIKIAHSLGIENPKVALVAATEQMTAGMPACVDAAIISKMADRGQIKGAMIDGPLSLDVAIDKESAEIKKITGGVAGDADCLVFHNIESGNTFFKACTKLAGGMVGAMVMGAKVPCVLTSRGDSAQSKMYSIALAANAAK